MLFRSQVPVDNLDQVIDGDLDAVIAALVEADRAEKIAGSDGS